MEKIVVLATLEFMQMLSSSATGSMLQSMKIFSKSLSLKVNIEVCTNKSDFSNINQKTFPIYMIENGTLFF